MLTYSLSILLAFCSIGNGQVQAFEPATRISFSLAATVEFSSSKGVFFYSYQVASSTASQQRIWLFDIPVDTVSAAPENIVVPNAGWFGKISPRGTVHWFGFKNSSQILPGKSLTGFMFQNSNPPDFVKAFAQGYVPLPPPVDFVDENTPAPPKFEDDVVYHLTVGPSTITFTDTASAIDHLISLKHQSVSLSWLRGREFIKDLDEKLEQAKKALVTNKPFEARHKLREFIHKLEEQRKEQLEHRREASGEGREDREGHSKGDKTFINDNAFFLLKPNAEFIISKLPQPKEKDEDKSDE